MQVLVTGHEGFIGKNLVLRLREIPGVEVLSFGRNNELSSLDKLVENVDVVVHLAGENRPEDPRDFELVNVELTKEVCKALQKTDRKIKLLLASSVQVDQNNPYGLSKLKAENIVTEFAEETSNEAFIYRLPNVFGKWCKPNYNSVVATFCHNISQDLPVQINDSETQLNLVYVDDVVTDFIAAMGSDEKGITHRVISPEYSISLGDLAGKIKEFRASRERLEVDRVGSGLTRALYATYSSYLQPAQFAYELPVNKDNRGIFVEMLKTPDSGQLSYFTAKPGVTRGGHYHHSKTEKFLVISGFARFGFRHAVTNERFELTVAGDKPQIVESIPGWVHDITNIGADELFVMLWANELFDKELPDTIASEV